MSDDGISVRVGWHATFVPPRPTVYLTGHPTMKTFEDEAPRADTRVSLGKAAHRCHGDLRCIEACVLKDPPKPKPPQWFRGPGGRWTRQVPE